MIFCFTIRLQRYEKIFKKANQRKFFIQKFYNKNPLSLQMNFKDYEVMTTIQLRAELFHEMNQLLDSEPAIEKVLAFMKGLVQTQQEACPRTGWADAAKQAHLNGEDKLLIDDVFTDEKMEDW